MAQIKGFAIRGLLKYVKESDMARGISGVLAHLPADSRPSFESPIDASAWYPYAAYAGLLEAVDRAMGGGDDAHYRRLGLYAARQDVNTLFKIIAAFSSVEKLLQRSVVIWRRYCDGGAFVTPDVSRGRGTGILRDFPEVAPEHCRLLLGWVEGMALAAGAKTVTVKKTRCIHRGDPHCEYQGTWS